MRYRDRVQQMTILDPRLHARSILCLQSILEGSKKVCSKLVTAGSSNPGPLVFSLMIELFEQFVNCRSLSKSKKRQQGSDIKRKKQTFATKQLQLEVVKMRRLIEAGERFEALLLNNSERKCLKKPLEYPILN